MSIWLVWLPIVIERFGPSIIFPLQTRNTVNIMNSWVLGNSSNNCQKQKLLWKNKMEHKFYHSQQPKKKHNCCFILMWTIQPKGHTQMPEEVEVGDIRSKILLWREKWKEWTLFQYLVILAFLYLLTSHNDKNIFISRDSSMGNSVQPPQFMMVFLTVNPHFFFLKEKQYPELTLAS